MDYLKKSIALSYTTIKEKKIFIANDLYFLKVLEGTILLKMNSRYQVLKKDDLLIIHHGVCFTLMNNDEHNLVTFMKLDRNLCRSYERGVGPRYYYANSAKDESKYPELYAELRRTLEAITHFDVLENGYELRERLNKLFDLLLNRFNFITCGLNYSKFSNKMLDRYTYIYKRYFRISNHSSLIDIADDIDLNYDYLRKDITKRYGLTYHQLKDIVKVNCAAKLVMDSELSLTDISQRTGFSDHKYMVNRFKSRFGMTPSELRGNGEMNTSDHLIYKKIL